MSVQYLYNRLPVFFQNIACSVYGYKEGRERFSKEFYVYLDKFKLAESLSADDIIGFKSRALSTVLMAAKSTGLYPSLINTPVREFEQRPWAVLASLPVLTKDSLRLRGPSFLVARNAKEVVTSGTTGKALRFYKDPGAIAAQWAIWYRHRARFGVGFKELSVNFTGKPVVPVDQIKPPFWRYNHAQRQYLISMQHINSGNIGSIVSFLNSISPAFYSGYPSIIAEVARLASSYGLELEADARPRVVFSGAENVLDYQRDIITQWTGADLTDQYGLSEGCCNFSKCEHGYYHEDFEFCHIEILDPEVLSDGSIKGRLVGTGFFNEVMPFLRYDTGDIAIMAPEHFRCPCGRESRVILGVEGRVDDFVVTPDGRRVMRFDYLFKNTPEAYEAQVVQYENGSITIRAVLSGSHLRDVFELKVKENFNTYISTEMNVCFDYVDKIEKSSTGKFKAVLNLLDTY